MEFWSLAEACAECRACEGAAYQTPPVLFAGNPNAPIVAIGQNPGEIKAADKTRQEWIHIFRTLPEDVVSRVLPVWYVWDFSSSPGYARLAKVFGHDWLLDGSFIWTNAVRCRTERNALPSKEMIDVCGTWTSKLIEGRKAIIMVGAVSRAQVLGDDAKKLEWGAPKRHPTLGYILAIKHYSVWRNEAEVESMKKAVDRIKELVL